MATMTKREWTDEELMDPNFWDEASTEVHEPSPNPRMSVRVVFEGADFHQVALAAEESGETLTNFIRRGALELAARRTSSDAVAR